jgi:hypothetical protein
MPSGAFMSRATVPQGVTKCQALFEQASVIRNRPLFRLAVIYPDFAGSTWFLLVGLALFNSDQSETNETISCILGGEVFAR